MGDIDGDTINWLSGLKLGEKLQYISDFENGYYMGVIFERLNLAKGRKFKNTKDMACKFQNFKNIRDLLLQNFNNILYNTSELLSTIKECILKYNRDKKQAALKRIQTFSASKIQPHEEKMFASRQKEILSTSKLNQTSKFPKKIQQIEQKLEKYKGMKTQHELMALQDRKKELEENRRLIDEHRLYQINKVRNNHQFIKEHERKVYEVWTKTQQIKQTRIQKDNNLKSFLEEKKNKLYQSMREEEVKSFKDGIQAFNLNCIRQGIELQHDPDKPFRKTEDNFNKQVVMERIKDNIKIHQNQRKQRIKRQNKKAVDAKEANIKAEIIWNQNNLVEQYAKKIKNQLDKCNQIKKVINRQGAQKAITVQRLKNRTFEELPQSKIDHQQREDQYRKRKIQYLDEQVQRLQRRQKKHKAIAQNALQALINIVIASQQHYNDKKGFTFQEWKAVQKQFLTYQKKDKKSKNPSKFIDNSYWKKTKQYINSEGSWKGKDHKGNLMLSQAIQSIVKIGYPSNSLPQKSIVPLYMPLKISFVGNTLSGKTTLSQKLAQKYGLVVINPVSILSEAFELNKEPAIQDPKKKKDSKKPQEENPEKIALKQWGQKMMKKITNPSLATTQHYLQAIEFKITLSFQNKSAQQIVKQFEQSKIQQSQRYAKAVKQYQQIQKKGKKDPKKPQSDEPPTEKKYFYSKGFVIDGIDLSINVLKALEKRFNGYLSFEERINAKGEEVKQVISNIIPVPKAKKDTKLTSGMFDLLIELQAQAQILENRQTGDKTPINHKNLTQLQKYYSDFGNEKTKQKAYKKINNQVTVEESITQISHVIEKHLDSKYQQILTSKSQKQEAPIQPKIQSPFISIFSKLNQGISEKLIKGLTSIYERYSNKVTQSFSDLDSLREQFGRVFLSTQQAFISIINRPDDKAGKILNFQQNYNKLQSQKANIVKDAQASKHLISKLDELYDGLWTSLESKKNEAVAQRQKLLNSNLLANQIQKLVQVARSLMQNELNLLIDIIFFIYNINNAAQGSSQEISPQYLALGIPPTQQPIQSFSKNDLSSNRLETYGKQVGDCLKGLSEWLTKKQKKYKINKLQLIEKILSEFIADRKAKILSKIQQIKVRVKQYYLEYYCYFSILINKMDDWIIQGIKYQNQFVYDIYKNIKKSIQQAKKSTVKDLFVKDITDILHPLTALTPNRLPIVVSTPKNDIKILSYATFMQQLRCISSNGRIHFKLFQTYIQKRRKSQLLEKQLLTVELDIMQQYLVTDDYCNYKQVALAMLLWKITILEEDSINEYENRLTGKNVTNKQSYQYLKQDISFEDFAIIPEVTTDEEQQRILKVFIFQIFRQQFRDTVNVKQIIDTLRLFSQLQVYKYGDTIMMLHQTKK